LHKIDLPNGAKKVDGPGSRAARDERDAHVSRVPHKASTPHSETLFRPQDLRLPPAEAHVARMGDGDRPILPRAGKESPKNWGTSPSAVRRDPG
jgi:hypothetical protein